MVLVSSCFLVLYVKREFAEVSVLLRGFLVPRVVRWPPEVDGPCVGVCRVQMGAGLCESRIEPHFGWLSGLPSTLSAVIRRGGRVSPITLPGFQVLPIGRLLGAEGEGVPVLCF